MKKSIGVSALTLIAASLVMTAPAATAAPISFVISGAEISWGKGYGVDSKENGGTLLDVVFAKTFAEQVFSLTSIDESRSFQVGTVTFREPVAGDEKGNGNGTTDGDGKGNIGIRDSEKDDLDVSISFTFTSPMDQVRKIRTEGFATPGAIDDTDVDYSLSWAPLDVLFGTDGKFQISLNALSFASNDERPQALNATVKMLALPQLLPVSPNPVEEQPNQPVAAVPEPASLALLGLGLAGLGALRRRQHKA